MKYVFTILILFSLSAKAQRYTDSFSRAGIMYYTTDKHGAAVKNFYPANHVHNTFTLADTLCKEKHPITFLGAMEAHCFVSPESKEINFTDGFIHVSNYEFEKAELRQGEALSFDGCKVYRGNQVIFVPLHRAMYIHTGMSNNDYFTKSVLSGTINGIYTDIYYEK